MLRTQIYLPEELRKEVDKDLAQTGESLSDYIRKAVQERTIRAKREKASIKEILAAQAKIHKLTLVTNNRSDFPMRDIKIITPN